MRKRVVRISRESRARPYCDGDVKMQLPPQNRTILFLVSIATIDSIAQILDRILRTVSQFSVSKLSQNDLVPIAPGR